MVAKTCIRKTISGNCNRYRIRAIRECYGTFNIITVFLSCEGFYYELHNGFDEQIIIIWCSKITVRWTGPILRYYLWWWMHSLKLFFNFNFVFLRTECLRKRARAHVTLRAPGCGLVNINGKDITYFDVVQSREQVSGF